MFFQHLPGNLQGVPTIAQLLKRNLDFQIRLDFNTFVISGPATTTVTIGKVVGGELTLATGTAVAEAGQCQTDTFSVGSQNNLPVLCGTLTGQHGKNFYPRAR